MKEKIIEILNSESFNITDQAGNTDIVISQDDFDSIAERIVKLMRERDRELLISYEMSKLNITLNENKDFIALMKAQYSNIVDQYLKENK